jgi:hypothetical protein
VPGSGREANPAARTVRTCRNEAAHRARRTGCSASPSTVGPVRSLRARVGVMSGLEHCCTLQSGRRGLWPCACGSVLGLRGRAGGGWVGEGGDGRDDVAELPRGGGGRGAVCPAMRPGVDGRWRRSRRGPRREVSAACRAVTGGIRPASCYVRLVSSAQARPACRSGAGRCLCSVPRSRESGCSGSKGLGTAM